jgi:hypothetical protein
MLCYVLLQVVVSAEKLLTQLLSRYTSLYWSHACMAALLSESI